ncbi:ATP-binding protein, partial [Methylobacterium sp. E-016]|nr:ATP-binding protein [Methylobacterium sp. E-016]
MVKLKLRGMRAAYDEVMTLAAKRHHSPEQVVGQLLTLQLADVESRATSYRIANARFPVMKTLAEFEFAGSPVDAVAVRELPLAQAVRPDHQVGREAVVAGAVAAFEGEGDGVRGLGEAHDGTAQHQADAGARVHRLEEQWL